MRSSDQPRWSAFARAARVGAGLSQAALAKRMGINRNTISRWELGYYGPDRPTDVIALADATGVDRREALAAAGFAPETRPDPPMDPDVRRLLRALADPDTPPGEKQFIRDFLRLAAQRLDALEAEQRRRRDVS